MSAPCACCVEGLPWGQSYELRDTPTPVQRRMETMQFGDWTCRNGCKRPMCANHAVQIWTVAGKAEPSGFVPGMFKLICVACVPRTVGSAAGGKMKTPRCQFQGHCNSIGSDAHGHERTRMLHPSGLYYTWYCEDCAPCINFARCGSISLKNSCAQCRAETVCIGCAVKDPAGLLGCMEVRSAFVLGVRRLERLGATGGVGAAPGIPLLDPALVEEMLMNEGRANGLPYSTAECGAGRRHGSVAADAAAHGGDGGRAGDEDGAIFLSLPFYKQRARSEERGAVAGGGATKAVGVLLDAGAQIDGSPGRGALIAAVVKGDLDMVRLLLSRGANVHAHNEEALREAIMRISTAMTRLLVSHGADVTAIDLLRVFSCRCEAHREMAELFDAMEADVRARKLLEVKTAFVLGVRRLEKPEVTGPNSEPPRVPLLDPALLDETLGHLTAEPVLKRARHV